jgi:hypothetical protein
MVLTRYYARIPFGSFEIELSRPRRDARFISIKLHATNATGLLLQVNQSPVALFNLIYVVVQLSQNCNHLISTRFKCFRHAMMVSVTSDELLPVCIYDWRARLHAYNTRPGPF